MRAFSFKWSDTVDKYSLIVVNSTNWPASNVGDFPTQLATSFPGFSPTRPTKRGRVGENPLNEVAQLVVHSHANTEVVGSNPFEALKLQLQLPNDCEGHIYI